MDFSSLVLAAGDVAPAVPQAFSRVETISDFVDIVFLALSGYDVAFEPISGSLTGFGKPMKISIIRRISALHPETKPQRSKLPQWHIVVDDSPTSIAKAIRNLFTEKSSATGITLDLTVIGQGDRAAAIEKMFAGFTRCLNQRAGRLLDNGDIADLLGWVATIVDTRFDAQVRYGSYPHWGAFMMGKQVDPVRAWTSPPPAENATRTLLCGIKPAATDLQQLVDHGRSFGLVNTASLRRRAPWAASTSADKTLAIGAYAAVPVATYTSSPDAIAGALAVLPKATGRNIHEHVEARDRPTWDDIRAISTAMYGATTAMLPAALQPAWGEKRDALHPYAIVVGDVAGDIADLARHAVDSGNKAARSHQQPMPVAVVATVPAKLDDALANARGLIGHVGPAVVHDLDFLDWWDDLVAVIIDL